MPWIMKHAIGLVGKVDTGVWICNNLHWCGCCSCGTVLPGCVRGSIALHISLNRCFAPFHSSVWPWVANPQKALNDQNKQTHIQTSWEFVVHVGIHWLCDVFFCCVVVLCCCLSSHTLHTQHIATSLCVFHAVCSLCFTLSAQEGLLILESCQMFFFLFFFLTLLLVLLQTTLSLSLKKKKSFKVPALFLFF